MAQNQNRLRVLNDCHLGAVRSAGTTQTSQLALRASMLQEFKSLLPDSDLMTLGDLFDTANIPMLDVVSTYTILADWLHDNPSRMLYNVAGNHDLSKTSSALSSFSFLGKLLSRHFPGQYVHIEQPTMTPYGYVIPHLRNQDLFDAALTQVPECKILFLHCNYNNGFAEQSDQSLNLSKAQADAAPVSKIVIAHEHHTKDAGKVILPGNQIASSISDWLSPADKRYATVCGDSVHLDVCNLRASNYLEFDWRNPVQTDAKFIRFTGSATQDEIGGAISTINKYRAGSDAFVVGNGIQVQSPEGVAEAFSESLTAVQSFDVIEALRTILTTAEMEVIKPYASQT